MMLRTGTLLLAAWLPAAAVWADEATPPEAAASVTAAASAPEDETDEPAVNPRDPYESLNRKVFEFNDKLDANVLKPVAETYQKVVPSMVRSGVSNVLGNLGDVWSAVNQLLQGKVGNAGEMTFRVLTNTVFGIGGLMDPATELGMERRSEDFGQTLGRWGVPPGPTWSCPAGFLDGARHRGHAGGHVRFAGHPAHQRNFGRARRVCPEGGQHPGQSAGRQPAAGSDRAGSLQLHPRRLPGPPSQPGLRRQSAGR
jgi:hypothetical protein